MAQREGFGRACGLGRGAALERHWRSIHSCARSNPFLLLCNKISTPVGVLILLAQREGFEPSILFLVYTISSRAP